MDKLTYIVKALSRTKRKDYENYVVNAVWQKLGDASLKPVTQQLVQRADGGRYFIDLYFPQLGMGVECDEGYHDSSAQSRRDRDREIELIDIIRQVADEDYRPLHVRVGGRTLEEVDRQIDDCVAAIRGEAERRRADGSLAEWTPGAPVRVLLADKSVLRVSDDIGFRSIAEACNEVMGCSYAGMQRSFFPPAGLRGRGIGTYAWFPKLSVDGETPASASGWVNSLSADGAAIFERNEGKKDWRQVAFPDQTRLVFAHMRDPVTGERLYRFVGVFRYEDQGRDASGAACNVYRRVSDAWAIVRAEAPVGAFPCGTGEQAGFLDEAIALLREIACDPEQNAWCKDFNAYFYPREGDLWNAEGRICSMMERAYDVGLVPPGYGEMYDTIGDEMLYRRKPDASTLARLSDRQIVAVVAKQFRSDRFNNGSLVSEYAAGGLMLPYLAELRRRWCG